VFASVQESVRADRQNNSPHLPVRAAPPARLFPGGALVVGVLDGGALGGGVRVVGVLGDGAAGGLGEFRGGGDSAFRGLF
jgi:hypothetical protein